MNIVPVTEIDLTLTRSEAARVLALRAAVKLETLGMKRGGRSATAIARDMIAGWGMHAPRARAEVLEILDTVSNTLRDMMQGQVPPLSVAVDSTGNLIVDIEE